MSNILVSMLVNVGDVIMMTSTLDLIRNQYSGGPVRLTALVRPEAVDLLANNPVVDQVIIYPYRSGSPLYGLRELRRQIKAEAFDFFLSLDRRPRGAAAAFLAGIPERVGPRILFDGSRPKCWTRFLYSRTVELSQAECAGSQVEMFQLVARRALGLEGRGRITLPPIDPDRDRRVREFLPAGSGPIIGLCVKTNDPRKTWPASGYAALMARLKSELGAFLYVTGGPADQPYIEDLLSRGPQGLALNLAGQTDLPELAALAARSDLFISPDNATAHLIANSVPIPLICLLVGTEPEKILDSMPRAHFLRFPPSAGAGSGPLGQQIDMLFEAAREYLKGRN